MHAMRRILDPCCIDKVRLTDVATGKTTELGEGDAAVLELGSSVRWEVLETVTKYFVLSPGPSA